MIRESIKTRSLFFCDFIRIKAPLEYVNYKGFKALYCFVSFCVFFITLGSAPVLAMERQGNGTIGASIIEHHQIDSYQDQKACDTAEFLNNQHLDCDVVKEISVLDNIPDDAFGEWFNIDIEYHVASQNYE